MSDILNGYTLAQLLEVVEAEEADNFVDSLVNSGVAKVTTLGPKKENDHSADAGNTAESALVERITNMWDALILDYAEVNGIDLMNILPDGTREYNSPRQVVDMFSKDFDGGRFLDLSSNHPDISELLGKCQVTLRGEIRQDVPTTSTIDVRDLGCGVAHDKMQDTILSLGGGEKTYNHALCGKYGHGSAVSYGRCNKKFGKRGREMATCSFIFTRVRGSNRVGIGIVRRDPRLTPPYDAGTPLFQSVVDAVTGLPFFFEISKDEDFEVGTLVRLFEYDLGKDSAAGFKQRTESLYYQMHKLMPDPILPVQFNDERTTGPNVTAFDTYFNQGKNTSFSFLGTRNRLHGGKNVHESGVETLFVDGESCKMTWYVFKFSDDARRHLSAFADLNRPNLLIRTGQTHGNFYKNVITENAGLHYLNTYLLVIVDTDDLDREQKRELFNSNRESVKDTSTSRALRDAVSVALRNNSRLEALNEEYKALASPKQNQNDSEEIMKQIFKVLGPKLDKFLGVKGPGKKKRTRQTTTTTTKNPPLPIPVQNPPTLFKVVSSTPVKAVRKGSFSIAIDTDADPSLFDDPSTFRIDCPFSYVELKSQTDHNGGHRRFTFKVGRFASVSGPGVKSPYVHFELKTPSGEKFEATVDVEIVEPKSPINGDRSFRIEEIENPSNLLTYGMTVRDVAKVETVGKDEKTLVVYVSKCNPLYEDKLEEIIQQGIRPEVKEACRKTYSTDYILTSAMTALHTKIVECEEDRVDAVEADQRIRQQAIGAAKRLYFESDIANLRKRSKSN